jgi:hypothetical protein
MSGHQAPREAQRGQVHGRAWVPRPQQVFQRVGVDAEPRALRGGRPENKGDGGRGRKRERDGDLRRSRVC